VVISGKLCVVLYLKYEGFKNLLPKIKENKVDPVISKDQIVNNHFSGKSKLRIQSKLVWSASDSII